MIFRIWCFFFLGAIVRTWCGWGGIAALLVVLWVLEDRLPKKCAQCGATSWI